jgi:hypothetical protein
MDFNLLLTGSTDAAGVIKGQARGVLSEGTSFQEAEFEFTPFQK